MAWTARTTLRRIALGVLAASAASAALACPPDRACGFHEDHQGARHDGVIDRYGPPRAVHERPELAAPPCRAACGGEITLPASFFSGSGGVGPIPSGPDYAYGYVIVGGHAGARAYASASASAAASASVRISGGGRHGGCCR